MDTTRIRHLLDRREEIDREIIEIVTGQSKKVVRCSVCSTEGHTARNCPVKSIPPSAS